MTLLNYGQGADVPSTRWDPDDMQGGQQSQPGGERGLLRRMLSAQGANVGPSARAVSVAAGSIVTLMGLGRRSLPGLLLAGVGGALLHRGITGHCYAYQAAGIDTAHETGMDGRSEDTGLSERGIEIRQTLQVNKSADELYAYWRDFTNLPRIMTYLESVRVDDADGRRSHWVAKAPKLAGGKVEWDAELTADEPGRRVAWRSLQGGDIDTDGEVRFAPGLGDRGTEVHVNMRYVPPGGRLGHMLTSLMGENPKRVVREDLRNFKRVMEIGEVLTTLGQSHGTCTGKGKPYTESDWKPLFT